MTLDLETFQRHPWLILLFVIALVGDYLLFKRGVSFFVGGLPFAAFVLIVGLVMSYDAKHPRDPQI
jgi:hypothetical protein